MEKDFSNLFKNAKEDIWDLQVNYPKSDYQRIRSENKTLPYLKFFKKGNTERDIIKWPSKILPKLSQIYDQLPLNKKGGVKRNMIAHEFAKYWANLGEEVNPEIIETYSNIVKEIFSIEVDLNISCAICIIIKEMLCVPRDVAFAECQTKASTTAAIKRQIKRDISIEKKKISNMGFGKPLLPKDIFFPPTNDTKKIWMNLEQIPADIESFSNVWEGITGLKSTRDYYEWLTNHTERNVPEYLKNHCFDDTKDEENQFSAQSGLSPTLPDALIRRKPIKSNVCR